MNVNKKRWDELVGMHFDSKFYDVENFLTGGTNLCEIEQRELPDLRGKRVLHLQCHFGMDSLALARDFGAIITGVDYSQDAIAAANLLKDKLGVAAEFICCNVYDLPNLIERESFDFVYTSYGVLVWLPDLTRWAEIIDYALKPNGQFYMVESHPIAGLFDEQANGTLIAKHKYFKETTPMYFNDDGDYTDSTAEITNKESYEWNFSISEVLNALLKVGLQLNFLNEHLESSWQRFQWLVEVVRNKYVYPDDFEGSDIPLTFSLLATKCKCLS